LGTTFSCSRRQLFRQTALPDSGLAADENELSTSPERGIQRVQQDSELALTSDEDTARTACLRGPLGSNGRRRRHVELWVLTKNRLLELLECAAGLEPELLQEDRAG